MRLGDILYFLNQRLSLHIGLPLEPLDQGAVTCLALVARLNIDVLELHRQQQQISQFPSGYRLGELGCLVSIQITTQKDVSKLIDRRSLFIPRDLCMYPGLEYFQLAFFAGRYLNALPGTPQFYSRRKRVDATDVECSSVSHWLPERLIQPVQIGKE